MKHRRLSWSLRLEDWPVVNVAALSEPARKMFGRRRRAIEAFCSGATLTSIEKDRGVGRSSLYWLPDRCVEVHDDGRPWRWRALTPYVRTDPYRRTAGIELTEQGAGAAGAFSVLLQVNPGLQDWITQAVSKKRVAIEKVSTDNGLKTRLRNLKPLHLDFLKQYRALGLSGTDYPFNTERMGIRSLAVAVRAE